jgi:hypothetical protein
MNPMGALNYLAAAMLALGACPRADCQQVAFTSRGISLDCPITISSFTETKAHGFESVVLSNDGELAVSAVYLEVTFRTDAGEETVDERRVTVEIDPHEAKRAIADLGDVTGLRQKAKSARQDKALAILSVKSVEFQNGTVWRPRGPAEGTPIDPPVKPPGRRDK